MIKYYPWQLHLEEAKHFVCKYSEALNRLKSFLPLEQFHTLATRKNLKEATSAKLNPAIQGFYSFASTKMLHLSTKLTGSVHQICGGGPWALWCLVCLHHTTTAPHPCLNHSSARLVTGHELRLQGAEGFWASQNNGDTSITDTAKHLSRVHSAHLQWMRLKNI